MDDWLELLCAISIPTPQLCFYCVTTLLGYFDLSIGGDLLHSQPKLFLQFCLATIYPTELGYKSLLEGSSTLTTW